MLVAPLTLQLPPSHELCTVVHSGLGRIQESLKEKKRKPQGEANLKEDLKYE